MSRHWRMAVLHSVAVVVAVAAVLPAASGLAAVTSTGALPAQLIGTWTRKVTSADIKRTGGNGITAGSVWTLTIKKSGYATISGSAGAFEGYVHAAGAGRFRTSLGIGIPAVYKWRVSGRLLTLTKVSDPTPDREAVFEGVWKRK
jgi:hypothetical protein